MDYNEDDYEKMPHDLLLSLADRDRLAAEEFYYRYHHDDNLTLQAEARKVLKSLANAVRQIDSHLMSELDAAKRLRKVNLSEDASAFEQGAQLIEYTNIGIAALIKLLKGESS